jgi:hypothetical protein
MTPRQFEKLKAELIEAIGESRNPILDPVEQELAGTVKWPVVRSRLLKALGERGLEGRVTSILHNFQLRIESSDG